MSMLTSKELTMAIEVVSQARKENLDLIVKLKGNSVKKLKVPEKVVGSLLDDKKKLDISYENVIEDLETALIIADRNEEV